MHRCRTECHGSGQSPSTRPAGPLCSAARRSAANRGILQAALFVLACLLPMTLCAADRDLDFLRGLRERRYFDYALLYLDQLEKRPGTSAELKTVLPYERAVTHLKNSETLRNNDARAKELDLAESNLEKFVKANPDHLLAGQAASQRAEILLGRARVEVWQSRAAGNSPRKKEFQERGRQYVAKAREVFQLAHDRHKAEWDKLPRTPIDPKNVELKATRDKVETAYLRAQLDLAICTYEESQTHDAEAPEFRKLLMRAAGEFEKIHEKYRSQVAGLHARMWQGKCFEEQGEIGKALGIYGELLQHPGRSDTMQQLQDRVLQFRLICLNHPQTKDYQLAVQDAGAWLAQSKERASSSVGLGIRWERARAFEQLGSNKDALEHEREQRLKDALDEARIINRYAGEYKEPSTAMLSRLNAALQRDPGGPKDFDGALAVARKKVNDIAPLNERIAAAESPEQKEALQKERTRHLNETAQMLKLALDLAQPATDRKAVHNARYLLAFVNYELKNSFEAGILADYVARRLKADDAEIALESAFLSFAAWQQAFFAAPEASRAAELHALARSGDFLVKTWPESERAASVRMTLGQIHDRLKRPLEAVGWYQQISESSDQYAAAQIAAGQAYWTAWLNAAGNRDGAAVSAEERAKWQTAAEQLLQTGIAHFKDEMTEGGTQPTALIAAKVSLAQIKVSQGGYSDAVRLLTEKPHAPLEAIAVVDEASRPAEGIQGRPFAGLVYQLLLRAYVGNQQIEEALSAMQGLERIAGGAGGEGIAAVYVSLGREIQKEIERLVSQKDQARLSQVRDSFNSFLNTLFERKQGMSYGSLIWIAETYYGLGQGMADQPADARDYFKKAADTYKEILERDKSDAKFVPTDREPGVKLRLVDCLKREGKFDAAFELVRSVLKDLPRALDAQFEAAALLQEWGKKEPEKYLIAIDGTGGEDSKKSETEGFVWGWTQSAIRLQRLLAAGTKSEEYRDKFAEARYNLAVCRRLFGLSQSTPAEKNEVLSMALQDIEAFALVGGEISDEWWTKLNTLYQQVQKDLGRAAQPLKKPEVHVAGPAPVAAPREQPASTAAAEPKKGNGITKNTGAPRTRSKVRSGGSLGLFAIIGLMLAIGAGAGYLVVHRRSSRKRRVVNVAAGSSTDIEPPRKPRPEARTAASTAQTRGVKKP